MDHQSSDNPYASPAGINWDAGVDIVNAVAVEQDGSLTIDYELAIQDLVALTLHRHRTAPALRRAFLWGWLAYPLLVLVMSIGVFWIIGAATQPVILLAGGLAAVVIACLYPSLYRHKLTRLIQRVYGEGSNDGLLGPHRMVITPTAVTDLTSFAKTSWKWSGVDRIDVTPAAAYIFVSSLNAFIVPRRTFGAPEEFDLFVQTAREFQAGFQG